MLMIHLCLNRWNSGGSQESQGSRCQVGGEAEAGIRQWLELGLGLVAASHVDSLGRECCCLDVLERLLRM